MSEQDSNSPAITKEIVEAITKEIPDARIILVIGMDDQERLFADISSSFHPEVTETVLANTIREMVETSHLTKTLDSAAFFWQDEDN